MQKKNSLSFTSQKSGCLTLGYYGENCSAPCPENCKGGDSDIVDGTCISCVPGYKGSMCNEVCGACYEKEQCDYKNGTCPNGCEDGYKGRQCKTVCNNNTYGPNTNGSKIPCPYENPLSSPVTPCLFTVIPCAPPYTSPVCYCKPPVTPCTPL
ncbi:scavenger receptor class F member 2-like [Magallana gigas]|uniref:scavenger receptor class F member 2-like n=1 Tax=Magallana gigas TaxID=29159 RepID=UPI0033419509